MNELLALSLTELALLLRARRASPVELMEAVLARIEETNADLNAFVAQHPREKLLAAAKNLSAFLPERKGEIGRSLLAGLELAEKIDARAWGEMARKRAQLNDWCAALFQELDFLLTPTVPFDPPPAKGPFPRETEGRRQRAAGVAAFTIPFNCSWHPAATVRAGLSRRGLPVGLQIVGPRHRDDLVLRAALAFERERPWHPHWPIRWEKRHD